jgi:hypothetical protein
MAKRWAIDFQQPVRTASMITLVSTYTIFGSGGIGEFSKTDF